MDLRSQQSRVRRSAPVGSSWTRRSWCQISTNAWASASRHDKPGRFQFVGPKAPLLAHINRPISHHAAIGQGVEDRRRRLCGRGRRLGRRRCSAI